MFWPLCCIIVFNLVKVQLRHFIDLGIRKRYMEVLALVNYGEILRKTHRELNKRSAENLNEMIHKGLVSITALVISIFLMNNK